MIAGLVPFLLLLAAPVAAQIKQIAANDRRTAYHAQYAGDSIKW
ncbi:MULTISPECIES: hypothetical protein [Chitinophaga]|nr:MULTISPECIES: hypothetical protein [Chitinophaga]